MEALSAVHLAYLGCTVLFLAGGMFAVSKLPAAAQNVIFVLCAVGCSGGIFFRYGMGLQWTTEISWGTLAMELMQVCNFNFLLLPLMLIPKFELARQYSCMFSMFGAFTTFLSPSYSWAGLAWSDSVILNSWLNHTFAVALPLFMIAARRLKPQKKYILPVLGCVFAYFTVAAGISYFLIQKGILTVENSFSFIFTTDGIPVFEFFYKLIPYPYFYLYPVLLILLLFFVGLCACFSKYRVRPFRYQMNSQTERNAF